MSNILGIIGSPRQFGNCELVVKEISRRIKIQHRLRLLRLSDFEIKLCNGCFRCLFGDQKCVLKDDLYTIVDAIADADALILTVPTYVLSANSSLKIVLDRCLAMFAYGEKIWGKPAVGVAIAGIPGKEGSALLDVERFLHVLLADIKKVEVLYGALPGEIFFKGDNLEITEMLARSLFGPKSDKREYSCKNCGGDTHYGTNRRGKSRRGR